MIPVARRCGDARPAGIGDGGSNVDSIHYSRLDVGPATRQKKHAPMKFRYSFSERRADWSDVAGCFPTRPPLSQLKGPMKITIATSLGCFLQRQRLIQSSLGKLGRRYSVRALLLLMLPIASLPAAQLQEARVSQVIHDVKLLPQSAAPRPAKVSDQVRNGTAVRTGEESRTELTFSDQTLARLGANTIFTFDQGTRNLELSGGAMLLRVPKNAGGAQIHTAAVSAAITGTTVMLEYHPNAFIKFIVLEGTGRIFRKDHLGESVLVHAGQMLIVNPKATNLPDPVDVDLKHLTGDFETDPRFRWTREQRPYRAGDCASVRPEVQR